MDILNQAERILTKDLFKLLDMGYFNSVLHFTFNVKSGLYNVKVIKKCLQLLGCKNLSFTDIQEIRICFSTYEALDQRGIKCDVGTLMRALKMCGRLVAPQKLKHYIKHKKISFIEKGRLQLYEFLDLLALCELQKNVSVKEKRVAVTAKTFRNIYEVDDMVLATPDEKLNAYLNEGFKQETFDYRNGSKELRLQNESSIQSPQIKHQETPYSERPKSVTAKSESKMKCEEKTSEDWIWVIPVPQLKIRSPSSVFHAPIISPEDISIVLKQKESLQYEIKTLEERKSWELKWKMNYYLPGYKKQEMSEAILEKNVEQKPVQKRPVNSSVLKRLASPAKRSPSPRHALACDAHTRGISSFRRRPPQPFKTCHSLTNVSLEKEDKK
ncbi:uncharacterized protein LOC122805511 [Protopterus annectens]|uniref:uncharacterized protein LOC122805511 n=1 Tax=Protopterus annectens TaxID=7888 RepID=UPI001CFBA640|nr:uncharacterized protein LOC122805511 [Protopterus annectens]